jgi:hypothetical protein
VAACALVSLPLIVLGPLRGDEQAYHYPLAVAFSRHFPLFEWDYTSAYTPLPYVVTGLLMKLLGPHLIVARVVNLLVGILGIVGFYRTALLVRPGAALWAAVFVAFAPYYLRDCSVFYVAIWPVVCSVWALLFYLRRRGRRDVLLASVFMGAGSLSGQWAIIIVVAAVASECVSAFDDRWKSTRPRIVAALATVGVILLFQIPVVAVFIGWGGLTPWRFRAHSLEVTPQHLVGALAVIGFTFAWWVVARIGRLRPFQLTAVVALVPLFLLALPEVSVYQGASRFTGLTAQILGRASNALGSETAVLLVPAAMLGVVALWLLLSSPDAVRWPVLRLATVLSIVTFTAAVQLGESHTRIAIVIAFLLAIAVAPGDRSLKLVVTQSSLLGVLYAVYHAFIKAA